MLIYISGGNGVDEVCRGVWHFYHWLRERYDFELLQVQEGGCTRCYKSLLLRSDEQAFAALEGTLLWQSPSPFRPAHRRKNWYFALLTEQEPVAGSIDRAKIIFQTMRSPKKGGQHVNRRATGVRALYPPLGISAVAYDMRSQKENKKLAQKRLLAKIDHASRERLQARMQERWRSGKAIERGNPVKIFKGADFTA